MNIEGQKLTKSELNKLMTQYDFVQFVKDLDHRADEAKKQERLARVKASRMQQEAKPQ